MKFRYLGHSSFLITSAAGTRIITDPYTPGDSFSYAEIREPADAVTVSHDHFDHNYTKSIPGKPRIIKELAEVTVKDVRIKGVAAFHDESKGAERGNDIIYCLEIDGMRLCHLGDLGQQLNATQLNQIGKVDILMIPVGGFYTIDAKGADRVAAAIGPKVIIPMHYKTSKLTLPIAPVDDFLAGKKNVTQLNTPDTEFQKDKLPASTRITVLKPAL